MSGMIESGTDGWYRRSSERVTPAGVGMGRSAGTVRSVSYAAGGAGTTSVWAPGFQGCGFISCARTGKAGRAKARADSTPARTSADDRRWVMEQAYAIGGAELKAMRSTRR